MEKVEGRQTGQGHGDGVERGELDRLRCGLRGLLEGRHVRACRGITGHVPARVQTAKLSTSAGKRIQVKSEGEDDP